MLAKAEGIRALFGDHKYVSLFNVTSLCGGQYPPPMSMNSSSFLKSFGNPDNILPVPAAIAALKFYKKKIVNI